MLSLYSIRPKFLRNLPTDYLCMSERQIFVLLKLSNERVLMMPRLVRIRSRGRKQGWDPGQPKTLKKVISKNPNSLEKPERGKSDKTRCQISCSREIQKKRENNQKPPKKQKSTKELCQMRAKLTENSEKLVELYVSFGNSQNLSNFLVFLFLCIL